MVARSAIALACLTLLAVVPCLPAASAGTPIPAHGDVIVFADKAGGNEWWVEAVLSGGASGSVQSVDAMDTGGPWTAMTHHPEWGSWAASFHVEPGHQVRFRATWAGGEQAVSCWFDHPSGVEHCPTTSSSTTTSGSTFAADWTNVHGNAWWVQAHVTGSQPIAAVAARVDCAGSWHALRLQSWGDWAASFNVPDGHVVDFRATSSSGAPALSTGYIWPDGRPTSFCGQPPPPSPPGPGGVKFSNVQGNPWWVEAVIHSTAPVHGAWVVFDCDPNRDPSDMAYHADWGKWALGLGGSGIPDGTHVSIQAYGEFPGFAESPGYVWPKALETTACPADNGAWPVDGSTAEYHLHHHVTGRSVVANVHLRYVVPAAPYSPGWTGTCDGATTVTNPDGTQTTTNWTGQAPVNPPVETRLPRVGFHIGGSTGNQPALPAAQTINPSGQACFPDDGMDWNSTATGTVTKQMSLQDGSGQPRTMTVWHAEGSGGAPVIEWETKEGLVLHWSASDMNGFTVGDLIRTDAPV